jgi:3-oxoacyl-[acyl-carrier-protein] synthase II
VRNNLSSGRRVVITGIGVNCPIGSSKEAMWESLAAGRTGVGELTQFPSEHLPTRFAAEAREFTGEIDNFGPLEKEKKKNIRKALKAMCREMQMGLAVAQLALNDAKIKLEECNRDRFGVVYGCDYILSPPQEFVEAINACRDEKGKFQFSMWGELGRPRVEPLWLLKYLPNLPACYIGIFNDLRGPNNSITVREASPGLALGEAYETIVRGHADQMLTGATGTRVHIIRSLHTILQEQHAKGDDAAKLARPFDLHRSGVVLGEGAGAFVIEELETAQKRGAPILAEIVGHGSSTVSDKNGVADLRLAMRNSMAMAMRKAKWQPEDVGHINAHGLSTTTCDAEESLAICDVLGGKKTPVVAAKSYFGNLGAGGGVVEMAASILSLRNEALFPSLNYDTPDPACPVNVNTAFGVNPGSGFLKVNVTPQGQASAVAIAAFH